jgi:predicted nucleotidyltransferase
MTGGRGSGEPTDFGPKRLGRCFAGKQGTETGRSFVLTGTARGTTIEGMHGGKRASTPSPSVEEIGTRLRPFFRKRNVLKAIVFGSWARGTNTRRSDLDLAVVLETERAFLDRRQDLCGIEDVLDGLHPELLIYAPGELEAISHRPFIRRVLSEGITIYER